MIQPHHPYADVVRKRRKQTKKSMKQPLKWSKKISKPRKERRQRTTKERPKYGTSKLETYFADNFLKKLGLLFVYQWHAKEIGRYYDFAIVDAKGNDNLIFENRNGVVCVDEKSSPCRIQMLIEVDGDYWHGNGLEYEEMDRIQKRSARIDELKDEYCRVMSIPLLRVSETDIRKNPRKVMSLLKKCAGATRK